MPQHGRYNTDVRHEFVSWRLDPRSLGKRETLKYIQAQRKQTRKIGETTRALFVLCAKARPRENECSLRGNGMFDERVLDVFVVFVLGFVDDGLEFISGSETCWRGNLAGSWNKGNKAKQPGQPTSPAHVLVHDKMGCVAHVWFCFLWGDHTL